MKTLSLSEIGELTGSGTVSVHGSAVVFEGKGVLLFGPSGVGKSTAALAFMALGADLLADDRVLVGPGPALQAPEGALALIEARGIGLLHADLALGPVPFTLAIDLGRSEHDRLPPSRYLDCERTLVPLILAAGHPNLAPVVVHYLRKGRRT